MTLASPSALRARRVCGSSLAIALAGLAALVVTASCGDDGSASSAPDIQDDDVADDAATDTSDAEPTDPWVRTSCETSCDALEACEDDTCVSRCVDALSADPAAAKAWICEAAAGCDGRATCRATTIPDLPECRVLCAELTRCESLDSADLGPDGDRCVMTCSGQIASFSGALTADAARCWAESLARDCNADGTRTCDAPPAPANDSCANTCRRLADECGALPDDLFADQAACDAACRALEPLAQVQTDVCTAIAGCERYERCIPPASATSASCDDFCDAWLGACPSDPGLNRPVCEAYCRAIEQAGPGFDTAAGATCIAALPQCPLGEELLACATPEWPACDAICSATSACGIPATDCQAFCPLLGALEPAARDTIAACVETSGCAGLGACFAPQ